MSITLDKTKMHVISTAGNGVVNKDTIFLFSQEADLVTAEYEGGPIKRGYLVGTITGRELKFSYCQLQSDDRLDNGISSCEISISENGKLRLTEHFEWKSRPGEKGTNIFEEL